MCQPGTVTFPPKAASDELLCAEGAAPLTMPGHPEGCTGDQLSSPGQGDRKACAEVLLSQQDLNMGLTF